MNKARVSIIIPVYNAAQCLKQCIESIVNQTYNNYEVIIVDDGSEDNTYAVMEEYSNFDSRIKAIYKEHSGISCTRNSGLDLAKGDYVMFADADDCWESTMLEKMVSLAENTNSDLVVCKYYTDTKKCFIGNTSYEIEKASYYKELFIPQDNIAAFVWNRLYKYDIVQKNEIRFSENVMVCEDTLFNYEYAKVCNKIMCYNEALYCYQINTDSVMFKKGFNKNKLTAEIAYMHILNDIEDDYKIYVKIAASWFFEIAVIQILKTRQSLSKREKELIKKMLTVDWRTFAKVKIPLRYRMLYPLTKFLGGLL